MDKQTILKVLQRMFLYKRVTSVWHFWVIACLILGSSLLANAASVSVQISEPRGGFGDTAANLLMIERLAEYYRKHNVELNVIYQPGSTEQIHTLWPDFNPNLDDQIVRGITFSTQEKARSSDITLTFSEKLIASKNKLLMYYEYEQTKTSLAKNGFLVPMKDYDVGSPIEGITKVSKRDDVQDSARIVTGIGKGLYVMDGFKPEDFNKPATFQHLRKFSPSTLFSDQAKLAYAYCSSLELAQQYVNSLDKFSSRNSHEIVVVTNHPVQTSNPLIKVISMKGLPFDLNQKVIKSSDIPILVTGDGSLSLAIEGRKPFFYSLYAWKRLIPMELRKAIEAHSPMLKKDKVTLEMYTKLLSLDIAGNRFYEDMFLAVMENPRLQEELSRVYDKMVKTDSLVDFVQRDIDFFKRIKFNYGNDLYGDSVRSLWMLARKLGGADKAIQKAERNLFDSRKDPFQRVKLFLGLRAIEGYPPSRFGDILSSALVDGDYNLRIQLTYILQDIVHTHKMLEVYPFLTDSGKKEFKLIFKNLAAQDPMQWYPEKGSNALMGARQWECSKFYR